MAEPRVLFAIGGLGLGGSERQLMRLLSATHPERLQATVLTFSSVCDTEHERLLRELGVELIQLPPSGGPRATRPATSLPRAFSALRRARPDVVYAWLEEASTTVTPAARALRIPVVIARRSVIGSGAERQARYRIPIRWAERHAALVTGNSNAVIERARERGVPPERLRLVRNGHPAIEALPPPPGNTVTLGYLANYRPEKGQARLLEALAQVKAKAPWRVDMAGSGPARERVAAEIVERGLDGRAHAGGPISDVQGFWAEHEVAVLLSDDEGSPNALIEAAMLGRPLVGTDGGGTAEVIGAGGGLVVSHEPADIARALERLIDDAGLRRSLGEGARRQALERYDLERFAAGHVAVLREALEKSRGRPLKVD